MFIALENKGAPNDIFKIFHSGIFFLPITAIFKHPIEERRHKSSGFLPEGKKIRHSPWLRSVVKYLLQRFEASRALFCLTQYLLQGSLMMNLSFCALRCHFPEKSPISYPNLNFKTCPNLHLNNVASNLKCKLPLIKTF